jgi:segregation and condensation protein B
MQDLLEAILFVTAQPIQASVIAKKLGIAVEDVRAELLGLMQKKNTPDSGVHVIVSNDTWALVTAPHVAESLGGFTKEKKTDEELSRSTLEALAIIAYHGPISQAGIDVVRGVNSTIILRSLLVRGLVYEYAGKDGEKVYSLSTDALRFLGVHSADELPDYTAFHDHEDIKKLLGL